MVGECFGAANSAAFQSELAPSCVQSHTFTFFNAWLAFLHSLRAKDTPLSFLNPMGDAVQSLISVHSVEVQSKLSVLSNSGSSTTFVGPNASPHASNTAPSSGPSGTKVKPTVKSSHTTKATNTSQAGKGGGGVSGGVIAAIVIAILVVAAGAGFLIWRRRRQQNSRARSGLWLESGSGYEASSKPPGEVTGARQSTYMFNGSGQNGVLGESRPISIVPPPPPAKEKAPESPNAGTTLLNPSPQPPSPIHLPRPRTPDPPVNPYAYVQDALAHSHHARTDSGPMVLYSTPRQDNYYGGAETQPSILQQLPLVSKQPVVAAPASSFPEPNTPTSLKDAPPMPVPVPEPVPAPPSPTLPSAPYNRPPSTHNPDPLTQISSSPPPPPAPASFSPVAPSPPPIAVNNNIDKPKGHPVIRTYIPTLLDELRISVGDRVVIVNEFDDGWAYCEKVGDADGAAGVVPLECLDRAGSPLPPSVSPVPSFAPSDPRLSNTRFSSFNVDFDQINNNRI